MDPKNVTASDVLDVIQKQSKGYRDVIWSMHEDMAYVVNALIYRFNLSQKQRRKIINDITEYLLSNVYRRHYIRDKVVRLTIDPTNRLPKRYIGRIGTVVKEKRVMTRDMLEVRFPGRKSTLLLYKTEVEKVIPLKHMNTK